ncbi:MAG: ABC transporter six-transmembrane domain-containing protein [Bacteroidota bacterium]|nr:ABC transporter six-transmembrane domain-containing protein [Bacteroidota bacterium]
MAFALVIIENVTFIAEPYVFGQAIDDLREANRIEGEVDSSVTNAIIQQAIDSVRDYILDSLSQTLPEDADSTQSFLLDPPNGVKSDEASIFRPALYRHQQVQQFRAVRKKHPRRDSLKTSLDKSIEQIKRSDTNIEAQTELLLHPPPAHLQQRVRRVLNKRDTIRQLVRSGKTSLLKKKTPNRDSLRSAIEKKPHTRRIVIGRREKKGSVGFSLPRDLGPFLPPMIPWVILFIVSSCVGAVRRVYDTRIYTRMFADLSSEVVAQQLEQGEDISKIAGRSSLAWQNIEFFQYNLPEFIEQLINVGGAVLALALFDWRVSAVGASLVLFVILTSRFYMNRIAKYQKVLNDMHEQEYNTFATKDPRVIKQYYIDISALEVKFSNVSATSYGILRVFLLIMFMTTLYISLDLDRFTIGELYSIVAYVWTFVTASEYIPYLSEKWVALKDTSRRLQSGELLPDGEISA